MAKKFVDGGPNTSFGDLTTLASQDGAALTLTNSVRILWDNTVSTGDLASTIDILKERVIQIQRG